MRLEFFWWLVVLAVFCLEIISSTSIPTEVVAKLESSLFAQFGFKGRPKGDVSKIVIPQVLLDLYQKQTGLRLDTTSLKKPGLHTHTANTVRSYTHVESPIDTKFKGHNKFRLKFDLSKHPKHERVKAAEITLTRSVINFSTEGKEFSPYQRILVYDILRPGIKGKREPITRLIDSKMINIRQNSTISVDVLPSVERWYENSKHNYGVFISIHPVHLNGTKETKFRRHVRLRRDVNEEDWAVKQPILLTYTDDGKSRHRTGKEIFEQRRKRAAKKTKRYKKEPCKRHTMHVDFTHVGWNNWIVAPPGYDAYYCKGECNFPFAEHMNTTNHGIVQSLINSVNPTKVPKPCCVPTQLSSMSMLYLDDDNKITLKNYRDMVVVGCGCR